MSINRIKIKHSINGIIKPAILFENNICSIVPDQNHKCAIIRMNNGDEFIVCEPCYDEWENDIFVQK